MIIITSKEQFQAETKSGISIADFYADWCGPCKMLSPIIHELEEAHPDAKFLKINVDENGDLAAEFGISSIPTVIFFNNGKSVEGRMGIRQKGDYSAKITELLEQQPNV